MAKTKEKLYDAAETARPYVDRALNDDDLHDNLKEAFSAARDVYAELLGGRNLTATAVRAATDDGDRATLIATDRRALFTAEVAEGTPVRPGERIRLTVDPARLHFFDRETSETLRPAAVAATT